MKSYKTKGVILAAVCAGVMRTFAFGDGAIVVDGDGSGMTIFFK